MAEAANPTRLTRVQCLDQANQCRRMARTVVKAEHRIILELMAEEWLRMAEDIEAKV